MPEIKIFIADSSVLIRKGLKALFDNSQDITVIAEAENSNALISNVVDANPDVVLIDYNSPSFKLMDIRTIFNILPEIKIVAITECAEQRSLNQALQTGLSGHLLKDCDEEEIADAIYSTVKGNKFFCGKILDAMKDKAAREEEPSCDGISLSNRELEIIKHVAEGKTNKEIAADLCLSTFTIMTHRKNIMGKLGINNTAGIVIYAVKENLISPNKFLFAGSN